MICCVCIWRPHRRRYLSVPHVDWSGVRWCFPSAAMRWIVQLSNDKLGSGLFLTTLPPSPTWVRLKVFLSAIHPPNPPIPLYLYKRDFNIFASQYHPNPHVKHLTSHPISDSHVTIHWGCMVGYPNRNSRHFPYSLHFSLIHMWVLCWTLCYPFVWVIPSNSEGNLYMHVSR